MSVYLLIPLLPLAAFLLLALGGRRIGAAGHRVAAPAVGLSFALSVGAFIEVMRHGPFSVPLYRFMQSGGLVIDLGLYVDQLTVLMLPLITGVSGVVHVYSSRYMTGDPRYGRFFAVTALFTFAMIMVVMSNNLLLLYIMWEIMGFCSYLLIGHWAERPSAGRAATRAFLTNAVADVGLGLGVILTFVTFGTLDIQEILARAGDMSGQTVNLLGWAGADWPVRTVTLITLLVFTGVAGKSAQIPFHVWLPFAMEAPTPVSALTITMANAGPFLLVRVSPLVAAAPAAMTVIAVIGGVTALCAAVVALTQTDIKRILAYSTISQLGFMTLACGVGAFVAAIFHVLAHGCLRVFLFLSTGNALLDTQTRGPAAAMVDRRVGAGVRARGALCLGALTLACLPPLVIFSGPYERLWTVSSSAPARVVFWTLGLLTVFVTAMAIFRGVVALFQDDPVAGAAGAAARLRPRVWSPFHVPVVTAGIVAAGVALAALWTWFANFLAPAAGVSGAGLPVVAADAMSWWTSSWIILPLAAAVAGWAAAYLLHVNPGRWSPGQSAWGRRVYVWCLNKGYADELYEVCAVRPMLRWADWLWKTIDLGCIDRVVTGTARVSVTLSRWLWQVMDVGGVERVGTGMGSYTVGAARRLRQHIEMRGRGAPVERGGFEAGAVEYPVWNAKPRMLQYHVLVMIFWLILAIGLFYWFAP